MSSRNPFECCPICGVNFQKHGVGCKPTVLSAIDAANTRAANADDIMTDQTWYPPPRDYMTRLREGFLMLADDETGVRGKNGRKENADG